MTLLRKYAIAILILALVLSGCNSKNIRPIKGGEKIGIVLMHGKGGDTRWVDPLASSLKTAGVKVITPNMAWHKSRIYDKSFEDSMSEINRYVKKLQSSGLESVYVAGHSLGAIAAAGYAARYDDVQGIILLAPGHFTGLPVFFKWFVEDLDKADSMIKSGKGNVKSWFGDINAGKRTKRHITANIFESWFSDTGPAEFVSNMKNLKGSVPVLYVAGSQDRISQTKNRGYAFDRAPVNPKSQFVIIDSGHLDVPRKADGVVIEWLLGSNPTRIKGSIPLNNEELKTFYTDKTHITVHHKRGPGKIYFGPDGSLHSKWGSGKELFGRWWIDSRSNTRCIRWYRVNIDYCHYTVRNTDGTHTLVHRKNGKKLVEIKSTVSGNQLD